MNPLLIPAALLAVVALPSAATGQAAAATPDIPSPTERYEALSAAEDYAGLVTLWRELPDEAVRVIGGDLEGSLALWEENGEARREEVDDLIARAVRGALAATQATGRRRILDYVTSFAGWDEGQKAAFRAGQQACGEGRLLRALRRGPRAETMVRDGIATAERLGLDEVAASFRALAEG